MNSILKMELRAWHKDFRPAPLAEGLIFCFYPRAFETFGGPCWSVPQCNDCTQFVAQFAIRYGGASGEKCFTVLKRVKKNSELRSIMSQERVSAFQAVK